MGVKMDRRQRKTREAIFNAFISLLSKKPFEKITVGEIIEVANIGRATFYSHFETKDFLLKELCKELFEHVFDCETQKHICRHNLFNCDLQDAVFLHLFKHIKKNDNNICKLLCSQNNELFLGYFKTEVRLLIEKHISDFDTKKPKNLPEDFWINHVTATFIETLRWWLENNMEQSPETITDYFFMLV